LFREKQQIVILAVAAAMVGGFVLFRYIPLREKMKTIEQTRTAQRLAIAKAQAQSKQLPVLTAQLQKLQNQVANFQANIPEQRDLGAFLQKIADLMNEHNLKEQVMTPGKEIQADNLCCIPIDMQCKGRLDEIFEFYKRLQGLDRLIRIEQVKLENSTDFSGEVSMHTKTVIYYRGQDQKG